MEELKTIDVKKNVSIVPVVGQAQHIGKMLVTLSRKLDIIREFESEPHRNRTCNLLIKGHHPYLLSDTDYTHPDSDIRQYGYDLRFAFYLLLASVVKLVGKMLASALRLRRSSN